MDNRENCGCGGHGHDHGESSEDGYRGHQRDCGCGGHGHHGRHDYGMNRGWHHEGCNCGCHRHHGGLGFHRRFISQEETLASLEGYLKQLQAEAKGVEERIAEFRKKG